MSHTEERRRNEKKKERRISCCEVSKIVPTRPSGKGRLKAKQSVVK
jgi:hypothetical protein